MDIQKLTPGRFKVTQASFLDGPDDRSDRDQTMVTAFHFFTRCSLWGKNVDLVFHSRYDYPQSKLPRAPERFPAALDGIKSTLVWIEAHRERIVSTMVEKRSQPLSLFNTPETEGMSEAKFKAYLGLQAVTIWEDGGSELTFNPWEPGSSLHLYVSVDKSPLRLNPKGAQVGQEFLNFLKFPRAHFLDHPVVEAPLLKLSPRA